MRRTSIRLCGGLAITMMIWTSYYLGLTHGKSVGYRDAAGRYRQGAFVASFYALEKVQRGEYADARHGLESFCFSTMVDIMEQQTDPESKQVIAWFKPDLIKYRAAHSNETEYPTLKRFDELLGYDKNTQEGVRP